LGVDRGDRRQDHRRHGHPARRRRLVPGRQRRIDRPICNDDCGAPLSIFLPHISQPLDASADARRPGRRDSACSRSRRRCLAGSGDGVCVTLWTAIPELVCRIVCLGSLLGSATGDRAAGRRTVRVPGAATPDVGRDTPTFHGIFAISWFSSSFPHLHAIIAVIA
jgi:hypothetical protein